MSDKSIDIFLSRPTWVSPEYQKGLENFLTFLISQGLNPRTIGATDKPIRAPMEEVISLMKSCKGVIVLGYPQVHITQGRIKADFVTSEVAFATEWNHIEGALAYACGLPIVLIHDTLVNRGVFERGAVNGFLYKTDLKDAAWPLSPQVSGAIATWKSNLRESSLTDIAKTAPKKKLNASSVTIGVYQGKDIALDILAKIVLSETSDPGINEFLKRVYGSRPYCPTCSTPLTATYSEWMAGGAQNGYRCENCMTNVQGKGSRFTNEIAGLTRENYAHFYKKYQDEINRLTGKVQDDYVLS